MNTEHDPPEGSQPPTEPTAASETPSTASELPAGEPTGPEPSTGIGRPFQTSDVLEPLPGATAEANLPPALADDALRDAVGAAPRRRKAKPPRDTTEADEGEPGAPRKSRKTLWVVVLALVVGVAIAALALLGRVNAERYLLTCTTTQAIAEQGRTFPPWGSGPLGGAEWKPIALPPNAQCKPLELDSREQLELAFLEMLLERTSAALTMRNLLDAPAAGRGAPNPLDVASAQLEQALLLSRAPERGDQRKQVERLLGDVQYWRASLRLRDATAALADASKQFDAAALQRPMHVSDAGAWAEFLRRITDELHAGPTGIPAAFPPSPTGERPAAPPGTALPVEAEPAAPAVEPAPAPLDAGVPTGGVLL